MDLETAALRAETAASLERTERLRVATEALAALTRRIEAHRALLPPVAGAALERWHVVLVALRAQGDQLTAELDELVAADEGA